MTSAREQDFRVVDGDGHVMERGEVARYLTEPYDDPSLIGTTFPTLSTAEPVRFPPGAPDTTVEPADWLAFLDEVGIACSIVYPSSGLSIGAVANRDWATALCRAYNDWLHDRYLASTPRIRGMALIPLQDVDGAVRELRRAVESLGMVGALLPAAGLPTSLGTQHYWPVYEEAERLGCALAVHGISAAARFVGMDHLDVRPGAHALTHPFTLMITCASMVFNGVFDAFPQLRVGFLEGGVAWSLLVLERFDRSYETHLPLDPRGCLLRLEPGQRVSDYLRGLVAGGRFFVGCEGAEPDLATAVQRLGARAFMFSSDYPHEVNAAMCAHEIEEVATSDLDVDVKHAILHGNAERFYGIGTERDAAGS